MRAVGCGAAPVRKGCVEEEEGIRGEKGSPGETEWGVPGGAGKQAEGKKEGVWWDRKPEERTGCMDRWMAGFKVFHLAHENVWCCKKCSLFAQ